MSGGRWGYPSPKDVNDISRAGPTISERFSLNKDTTAQKAEEAERKTNKNLTEATGSHPKGPSHEGGMGASKGGTLGTVEKAFHAALRQVDGGSEMGELELCDYGGKPLVAPFSRDRIGSVHRLKKGKHDGRETREATAARETRSDAAKQSLTHHQAADKTCTRHNRQRQKGRRHCR